jgi:uncharacterized membrane protein YfcA
MELSLNIAIGATVIGLVVGMLTGIFGVGGGFLMTPALMIILNIRGPTAVGTDLATILATSSFGMFKRRGSGTVDVKLGLTIATGSPSKWLKEVMLPADAIKSSGFYCKNGIYKETR